MASRSRVRSSAAADLQFPKRGRPGKTSANARRTVWLSRCGYYQISRYVSFCAVDRPRFYAVFFQHDGRELMLTGDPRRTFAAAAKACNKHAREAARAAAKGNVKGGAR